MTDKTSPSILAARLQKVLEAVVQKVPSRQLAVLFSGGFDSIFLTRLARRLGKKVTAVTISFENYNAATVNEAVRAAGALKVPHRVIAVHVEEYLRSCCRMRRHQDEKAPDWDVPLVHAAMGKWPGGPVVLLAGLGSDEWLGERVVHGLSLQQRTAQARQARRLHEKVAAMQGKKILFPFLTPAVFALSPGIPPSWKRGKKLLRTLDPEASVLHASLSSVPGRSSPCQIPVAIRRLAARVGDAHGGLCR